MRKNLNGSEPINGINKLIRKYKGFSQVARASFWYIICNIIQKSIIIFTVPIIARVLTIEEYGRFTVLNSWANIFFLFATLSICDDGYMVGIKKYYDVKDSFTSSVASVALLLISFILLLCITFRNFLLSWFGINKFGILIIFLYIYGQFGISLWYQKSKYDYKYINVVVITLLIAISTPCSELIFIRLTRNADINGDVGANLGYGLMLFLVGVPILIYLLKKGKKLYDRNYWKFAISFNVPLIPYYLAQRILNQSDRIMIERMDSATNAGLYSIAYSISNLLSFVNNALNSAIVPWKYRKLKQNLCRDVSNFTSIEIGVVGLLHVLLIIIIPELILVFAGEKYSDAVYVVPAVVAGLYLAWIAQQFISLQLYYEKTSYTAVSSCICATVNFGLNYVFIPRFGYIVAGYTTLFSYAMYMIIHIVVTERLIKKENDEVPYNKAIIIAICIFTVGAIIGLSLVYKYWMVRYTVLLIIMVMALIHKNRIILFIKKGGVMKK